MCNETGFKNKGNINFPNYKESMKILKNILELDLKNNIEVILYTSSAYIDYTSNLNQD